MRHAIRPGISASASSISKRPKSAWVMSRTLYCRQEGGVVPGQAAAVARQRQLRRTRRLLHLASPSTPADGGISGGCQAALGLLIALPSEHIEADGPACASHWSRG